MKVIFVTPCFNASKNLNTLYTSLQEQKNDNWSVWFVDDISTDDTWEEIQKLCSKDNRNFSSHSIIATTKSIVWDGTCGIKNTEKKFALRNIIDVARQFEDHDDIVIATVDGDDSLCNPNTVGMILREYEKNAEVVWTAHRWDINGLNISKPIPDNVDPYLWPWSSSHLRTFKANLLKNISDDNFKDLDGNWFKRGYDQALMLPLIKKSKKNVYIPEVCYQYNINSVSVNDRDWAEMNQLSTINMVRARGFIE